MNASFRSGIDRGGLQTGCATGDRTIFANGIDALRIALLETPDASAIPPDLIQHGPVSGGSVVALSLDLKAERWRHERPKFSSLGGPPPKHAFTDAGDPVGSGIAVANDVVFFTAIASGKLISLDAATGEVLKEIVLGPVWSGPSVARGRVYAGKGNTQFLPPQKYIGVLLSFGLCGEDEMSRLGAGKE
jgi:hypothetical protein